MVLSTPARARLVSRRVSPLRRLALVATLVSALLAPSAAHAQRVHVLAVSGLSGEPAYKLLFESSLATLVDSARARWHVAAASLLVVTEDPATPRLHATGRSTKEEIGKAFVALSRRVSP